MSSTDVKRSFRVALPIILGYVAIGLPCGILSASIGMDALQVMLMSALFYSGAGQFMIPNMWLAGSPIASIVASVSLVNTRQILYSATLAPKCEGAGRGLSFLFAATVTDESFGVNMAQFDAGDWTVGNATLVNLMSLASWTISAVAGVFIGNAVGIPLAMASFAMTSIFICLMVTQGMSAANVIAIAASMAGVYICKLVGLSGAAILVGALLGVGAAMLFSGLSGKGGGGAGGDADAVGGGDDAAGSGPGGDVDVAVYTAVDGVACAAGAVPATADGAGCAAAVPAACDGPATGPSPDGPGVSTGRSGGGAGWNR